MLPLRSPRDMTSYGVIIVSWLPIDGHLGFLNFPKTSGKRQNWTLIWIKNIKVTVRKVTVFRFKKRFAIFWKKKVCQKIGCQGYRWLPIVTKIDEHQPTTSNSFQTHFYKSHEVLCSKSPRPESAPQPLGQWPQCKDPIFLFYFTARPRHTCKLNSRAIQVCIQNFSPLTGNLDSNIHRTIISIVSPQQHQ